MNALSHQRKRVIAIIATLVAVVGYWPNTSRLVAKTSAVGAQDSQSWASTAEPGDFIIQSADAGASCRDATGRNRGISTSATLD